MIKSEFIQGRRPRSRPNKESVGALRGQSSRFLAPERAALIGGLFMMTSRWPRSSSGPASGPVRTRVSCAGEASDNAFKRHCNVG